MKLRHALNVGRVRVIGPGGGSVGACGGRWDGGNPKAPNPQTPSSRETSISNHDAENLNVWERLRTLKYACERLADGAVVDVAPCCRENGKVLRKLRGYVRVDAATHGYVRIPGERDGLAGCRFLTIFGLQKKGFGIIFTTKRVVSWESAVFAAFFPYFSRRKLRISRPFQRVGYCPTLVTA